MAAGEERLLADIGGTYARFALQPAGGAPRELRKLECARFASVEDAAEAYLAEVASARPSRAAFAVAAPVLGDAVAMINHPWSFSTEAARRRLGLAELVVVNDFAAIALAIPSLSPGMLGGIGGGAAVPGAPVAVIGPGTGLGVSLLVPAKSGAVPVATEGGHVTLAATDEREAAVIARIRARLGHVSAERALSGPGLMNLYRALGELSGKPMEPPQPDAIAARALAASDPIAVEAVALFSAMLGSVAGNLALTTGARGGVYVAGGVVPKLGSLFDASAFRARFEDKGRFRDYLARIPTFVITTEVPALSGLAALLDGRNRDSMDESPR